MGGRRFSIRKLFLDLLVIVCLVVAGWMGYQLFISRELNPIFGSIVLIVDIGVLIWNVTVLRSNYYRRMLPSFKAVFLPLFAVVLILTFAGVEPLSSYKDSIIDQVILKIDSFTADVSVDEKESQVFNDYELRGTYTATIPTSFSQSTKSTATFDDDIVTFYNDVTGKVIYKYFTGDIESAQIIYLTNIATGKETTMKFKYVAEYDCFTLGDSSFPITYYKR